MKNDSTIQTAIKLVGGYQALADELDVSTSYVYKWAEGKRKIPAHLVTKIVRLTKGKIKAEQLRPDIFN